MKGTSNLIIWLALALLVSLGMVLGLVLLLLGELYCSPFVRRLLGRHTSPPTTNNTTIAATITTEDDVEKQDPLPPENQETLGTLQQNNVEVQKGLLSHSVNQSSVLFISNPIYEDENGSRMSVNDNGTPFETPESSPSRLGTDDEKEISAKVVISITPPPMKTKERKNMNKEWRIQKNSFSRHKDWR